MYHSRVDDSVYESAPPYMSRRIRISYTSEAISLEIAVTCRVNVQIMVISCNALHHETVIWQPLWPIPKFVVAILQFSIS
jgi:hypothetical protein